MHVCKHTFSSFWGPIFQLSRGLEPNIPILVRSTTDNNKIGKNSFFHLKDLNHKQMIGCQDILTNQNAPNYRGNQSSGGASGAVTSKAKTTT